MSASFKVTKYENHLGELAVKFNDACRLALDALGASAESHAKDFCPVDTGRLRNSITHAVEFDMSGGQKTVHIGSNVEYAAPVEFRELNYKKDKNPKASAHFLRNAVSQHNDEYARIIAAALDGIKF